MEACLRTLPQKIKIGAYDWSVMIEDCDHDEWGQADLGTYTLRFWHKGMSGPSHLVGTVLHECLHVIFDNHGLGKMKRDKEEREEAIINGFESGLISLLRDNPKLLTWMKKWL